VVVLSLAAQKNVRALALHYRAKNYLEAAKHLRAAIVQAKLRITAAPDAGEKFPRPYPGAKFPGVLWIFEHRYWIAYRPASMTITGVFFDQSDIPSNISDV
jgi:plasmid stabilization system protein ParE